MDCVTVCATTAYCLVNFEHVHLGVLIALTCFTGLLCWPLIGLSGYHTYLIARNVTTHEDIKFQRRRGEDGNKNPFDLGSLTLNCHDTLVNPCKSQSIRTFEDQ